jgi:hypothetical protein
MVLVPLNVLLLTLYENVGGNRVNDDGLSPAKKQKKILFFSAWLMCMILCYICYIYAPFLKVKIAQWVFTSISTTDIRQPDSVEYITFKLKCVLSFWLWVGVSGLKCVELSHFLHRLQFALISATISLIFFWFLLLHPGFG